MRILCIGRHEILSRHVAALCDQSSAECCSVVGMEEGMRQAVSLQPEMVLCDVDLLAPDVMRIWEDEATLRRIPVLAVSLSRKPNEVPAFPGTPVAGFLYLPSLRAGDLERAIVAASGRGVSAPAHAYRVAPDAARVPTA